MASESSLTEGEDGGPVAPQGGRELYQAVRGMLGWLKWWARLEVRGLEVVPAGGPVLVVSNHDSWLDPLALIETMRWKDRPLRFLAKDTLWKSRFLAAILDRAGQQGVAAVRRSDCHTVEPVRPLGIQKTLDPDLIIHARRLLHGPYRDIETKVLFEVLFCGF